MLPKNKAIDRQAVFIQFQIAVSICLFLIRCFKTVGSQIIKERLIYKINIIIQSISIFLYINDDNKQI